MNVLTSKERTIWVGKAAVAIATTITLMPQGHQQRTVNDL